MKGGRPGPCVRAKVVAGRVYPKEDRLRQVGPVDDCGRHTAIPQRRNGHDSAVAGKWIQPTPPTARRLLPGSHTDLPIFQLPLHLEVDGPACCQQVAIQGDLRTELHRNVVDRCRTRKPRRRRIDPFSGLRREPTDLARVRVAQTQNSRCGCLTQGLGIHESSPQCPAAIGFHKFPSQAHVVCECQRFDRFGIRQFSLWRRWEPARQRVCKYSLRRQLAAVDRHLRHGAAEIVSTFVRVASDLNRALVHERSAVVFGLVDQPAIEIQTTEPVIGVCPDDVMPLTVVGRSW